MATVMLILGALHYLPESKAIQGTAEFSIAKTIAVSKRNFLKVITPRVKLGLEMHPEPFLPDLFPSLKETLISDWRTNFPSQDRFCSGWFYL